jgi:hypothetical protein
MTLKTGGLALGASLVATHLFAQSSVLFDFDSAPLGGGLPLTVAVGDLTATLTATGEGFYVARANTLGFTPVGFSGSCIYPKGVFASDLLISYSRNVTDFSILYAPEEYACDSSATMRVTAYLDATQVGTGTTNAQAGTWPSETLAIRPGTPFNKVLVHYDKPPATGGDWGPVFMVDNMRVTPVPPPIILQQPEVLAGGSFRLSFTQPPGQTFAVFGTTNAGLPFSQWTSLGAVTEVAPGQYQFTDPNMASKKGQFYRVSSP